MSTLTKEQAQQLNRMNVASQRSELGTLLYNLMSGDGLGKGDMLKAQYASNDKADIGYVDKSIITDAFVNVNTGLPVKIWVGTQGEYDGLGKKEPDILYMIK